MASVKAFVESQGATCRNWTWSWSYVNHEDRFVLFGAWEEFVADERELILADAWCRTGKGKKAAGYDQSRHHIALVEEEGYALKTFPMRMKPRTDPADPATRESFDPVMRRRILQRIGSAWYAVDVEQDDFILSLAEEVVEHEVFHEGAVVAVRTNRYERSPKARAACIAAHGCRCRACELDFAEVYGALGEGFIHVHHAVPLAEIGETYVIDPVKDLIPVCPNCHAMLHRTRPALTVAELRDILRR